MQPHFAAAGLEFFRHLEHTRMSSPTFRACPHDPCPVLSFDGADTYRSSDAVWGIW